MSEEDKWYEVILRVRVGSGKMSVVYGLMEKEEGIEIISSKLIDEETSVRPYSYKKSQAGHKPKGKPGREPGNTHRGSGRVSSRELTLKYLLEHPDRALVSGIGDFLEANSFARTSASPAVSVLKGEGYVEYIDVGVVRLTDKGRTLQS